MPRKTEILVFGTGSFGARIALDIASTAKVPVRVAIAGRNRERLDWLCLAANSRAAIFGSAAQFTSEFADLSRPEEAGSVISACEPKVVVQAASMQTSAVIATKGDAWSRLVAEGGLSATALFQALFSIRVAQARADLMPDD
jgi:saccharopine dehydrogenase-like NADP-dependent oxidoreductase